MQRKTLISLGVVVAVAALLLTYQRQGQDSGNVGKSDSESGLITGKNAIYVSDQPPSDKIEIGFVVLEKSGFIAIHAGENGNPAGILGVSNLIPAGETSSLQPIPLSGATQDGETLFAMLHFDDGDGVFDPSKDTPVRDVLGEPLMMEFSIDREAAPPDAISL